MEENVSFRAYKTALFIYNDSERCPIKSVIGHIRILGIGLELACNGG